MADYRTLCVTDENGGPRRRPERSWPVFPNVHDFTLWFEKCAKREDYALDARRVFFSLKRYGAHNKIDLNENFWTKILQIKRDNHASAWALSSFSPGMIAWYSRENDLLFIAMLERQFFKFEDDLTKKKFSRFDPKRFETKPHTAALPRLIRWVESRQDVYSELGWRWAKLLELAKQWQQSPLKFWKDAEHQSYDIVTRINIARCAYELLDDNLKASFVRQAGVKLGSYSEAYSDLFFGFTRHQLWNSSDWFDRVATKLHRFPDSVGLRWADNHSVKFSLSKPGVFESVLKQLPDFGRHTLLREILKNPATWDILPVWNTILQLPYTDREAGLRAHSDYPGALWHFCERQYDDDYDDELGANGFVTEVLKHMLPEHCDIWDTGATLNLSFGEMFMLLDSARTPLNNTPVDIPDFSL